MINLRGSYSLFFSTCEPITLTSINSFPLDTYDFISIVYAELGNLIFCLNEAKLTIPVTNPIKKSANMSILYVITGSRRAGRTRLADLLKKEFDGMIISKMDDLISDESSSYKVLIADFPDNSEKVIACQERVIIRIDMQLQTGLGLGLLYCVEDKMLARVLASSFKEGEVMVVNSMKELNDSYGVLIATFPEKEIEFERFATRTIIRIGVSIDE